MPRIEDMGGMQPIQGLPGIDAHGGVFIGRQDMQIPTGGRVEIQPTLVTPPSAEGVTDQLPRTRVPVAHPIVAVAGGETEGLPVVQAASGDNEVQGANPQGNVEKPNTEVPEAARVEKPRGEVVFSPERQVEPAEPVARAEVDPELSPEERIVVRALGKLGPVQLAKAVGVLLRLPEADRELLTGRYGEEERRSLDLAADRGVTKRAIDMRLRGLRDELSGRVEKRRDQLRPVARAEVDPELSPEERIVVRALGKIGPKQLARAVEALRGLPEADRELLTRRYGEEGRRSLDLAADRNVSQRAINMKLRGLRRELSGRAEKRREQLPRERRPANWARWQLSPAEHAALKTTARRLAAAGVKHEDIMRELRIGRETFFGYLREGEPEVETAGAKGEIREEVQRLIDAAIAEQPHMPKGLIARRIAGENGVHRNHVREALGLDPEREPAPEVSTRPHKKVRRSYGPRKSRAKPGPRMGAGFSLEERVVVKTLGELDPEARARAVEAMRELPEEDRALLVERYENGVSVNALAKARGVSGSAISQRMRAMREKLSGEDVARREQRAARTRPANWGKQLSPGERILLEGTVYERIKAGDAVEVIMADYNIGRGTVFDYLRRERERRGETGQRRPRRPTQE